MLRFWKPSTFCFLNTKISKQDSVKIILAIIKKLLLNHSNTFLNNSDCYNPAKKCKFPGSRTYIQSDDDCNCNNFKFSQTATATLKEGSNVPNKAISHSNFQNKKCEVFSLENSITMPIGADFGETPKCSCYHKLF